MICKVYSPSPKMYIQKNSYLFFYSVSSSRYTHQGIADALPIVSFQTDYRLASNT